MYPKNAGGPGPGLTVLAPTGWISSYWLSPSRWPGTKSGVRETLENQSNLWNKMASTTLPQSKEKVYKTIFKK